MKKAPAPPTDLDLLKDIYYRYYSVFISYKNGDATRSTKMYVPINVDEIASRFKVDSDLVFGRLYYHLNKKHGYRSDDGSLVHLFSKVVGKDTHCINFPLASSVLADLQREHKKYRLATAFSIASLIISLFTLGRSLLQEYFK